MHTLSQQIQQTQVDKQMLEGKTRGKISYKGCKILVRQNNITGTISISTHSPYAIEEPVGAIVNPANSELKNKGGAAYEIEDAGGKDVQQACIDYIQKNTQLKVGHAMHTPAGDLPCKYVIHVVGPKCEEGQQDLSKESKQLKKAVKNVLAKMLELDIGSISMLAISTGIFNFPLEKCVKIYGKQIKKFIDGHEQKMKKKEIIL